MRHSVSAALLLALSAALPATGVHAQDVQAAAGLAEVKAGGITISQPWARATAGRAPTAGAYITLRNDGSTADRLLGARTSAAARADMHIQQMDGDIMRMRPVDAIELPPGASVAMGPGGLHIMLVDLKAPLKAGDRLPLTLRFEKAGEVTVEAQILSIGAAGPGGTAPAAHDHGG